MESQFGLACVARPGERRRNEAEMVRGGVGFILRLEGGRKYRGSFAVGLVSPLIGPGRRKRSGSGLVTCCRVIQHTTLSGSASTIFVSL